MECGFSLPSRGQAAAMQNMRLLAQHVEALGLDSVWVSDHIIVPRHIDSLVTSHMVFDIMTADVAEMQRVLERFARDVQGGVRP